MFDFAWTEIALIAVVALIAIGPKDMPKAIKGIADFIKKARRMAGEFQSHVDELVKDTELADVRQQISQLRNFDLRGEVEKAVDTDGTLRATLRDDPFRNTSTYNAKPAAGPALDATLPDVTAPGVTVPDLTVPVASPAGSVTMEPIAPPPATPRAPAPAFIPPAEAAPPPPAMSFAPAFVPPGQAKPAAKPAAQPAAKPGDDAAHS